MKARSKPAAPFSAPSSAPFTRIALAVPAALLLLLAAAPAAEAGAASGWSRTEIAATGSYSWRYLPAGLDPGQPAPVVVFLHGSGALPEQWQGLLAPVAEETGVALVVPKSISAIGWGPGDDRRTVAEALRLLGEELAVDPTRVAIAGHSSGGAYALVLAYASVSRFSGVFALGAPYRTILEVADFDYTPPARLYYGTADPNYTGGSRAALVEQLERLGAPLVQEIRAGYGHSDWPATTLPDGFHFLAEQRYRTAGGCVPAEHRLCLQSGRFAVEGEWTTPSGDSGPVRAAAGRSGDSGLLYFFRESNWEVMVKVLAGCPVNDRWWVFTAASTNVGYRLTVRDLAAGAERVYESPAGVRAEAVTDTAAFATCF
jgi:predicted esterase